MCCLRTMTSRQITKGEGGGTTPSLLHTVVYEVSPKSSPHHLSFLLPVTVLIALFSPPAAFDSFFLRPITRSLVPRYRETAGTQRGETNEKIGTMKREQRARTSVDPPSGTARLICPITLNNPRDNSIAGVLGAFAGSPGSQRTFCNLWM